MENIKESVLSEKRIWFSFDMKIYHINYLTSEFHRKIAFEDYNDKKIVLLNYII